MPDHPYAVFGFSEHLDWVTLNFVSPVDDIRICSVCRIVARKAAFLPCRHVMCEPCYEQWKSGGSNVCFVDGDVCADEEFYWMEFPVEKMMMRKVSCWNRGNGCQIISDVSSIAEHFHRDCAYHSTSCPKCSVAVLRRNIVAHLESQCASHVLSITPTVQPGETALKELQDIRQAISGIGSSLRNISHDSACPGSTPGETARNNAENQNPLLTMVNEVRTISQTTGHALNAVKRSSERHLDHIVDFKLVRESLCGDLDEIKRAAVEWTTRDASVHQAWTTERKNNVEKLRALQTELHSVSGQLEELTSKARRYAMKEAPAESEGLLEILGSTVSVAMRTFHSLNTAPEDTVRIYAKVLKVPIHVVWCVDRWWLTSIGETENRFLAVANVATPNGYNISLRIMLSTHKRLYRCYALLREPEGIAQAAPPRKMKVIVLHGRTSGIRQEITHTIEQKPGQERQWEFLSQRFRIEDLIGTGTVQEGKIRLRFTFSY
ncbi:hypothetical protein MTO96_007640 [Rhipicephalus appendiculatus]